MIPIQQISTLKELLKVLHKLNERKLAVYHEMGEKSHSMACGGGGGRKLKIIPKRVVGSFPF